MRDWTQAQLAQHVGCAIITIKKIETALARPSKHLAMRIAIILDIPPGEQEAVVRAARNALAVDRLPPILQTERSEQTDVVTLLPQRHQLRTPLPDFVGQHSAITTLLTSLRQAIHDGSVAAISGVRGMGGIGKTELAFLVANHLTDTFPNAQIMLNLLGNHLSQGTSLLNLGMAYARLGKPHTAITYYEQALVIFRDLGERRHEGYTLSNLGDAYYSQGEALPAELHIPTKQQAVGGGSDEPTEFTTVQKTCVRVDEDAINR